MPRRARIKSKSGIYHIMLRGINKQDIFHCNEDRLKFLDVIAHYKEQCKIKILGWCFMNNHIHLLIMENDENLSITMKRIAVSYVWYYNKKYEYIGHFFQDRYRSEEIENENYLLTAIRYIHQNPVKANLTNAPLNWAWSSCKAYYGKEEYPIITDKEFILNIFSNDDEIAIAKFIEFNEQINEDTCLDFENKKRLNDEAAKQEIKRITGLSRLEDFSILSRPEKLDFIRKIKAIEGISQRQAASILGISLSMLFRG